MQLCMTILCGSKAVCYIYHSLPIGKNGEECITSRPCREGSLNAIVELPVLLEEVPSGQSTCSEQTKGYRSPELGLDTPACCCAKQGHTASKREL